MNNIALQKHNIYMKLLDFDEQDLKNLNDYIESIRYKKKLKGKNIVKLEGILKGHDKAL